MVKQNAKTKKLSFKTTPGATVRHMRLHAANMGIGN